MARVTVDGEVYEVADGPSGIRIFATTKARYPRRVVVWDSRNPPGKRSKYFLAVGSLTARILAKAKGHA